MEKLANGGNQTCNENKNVPNAGAGLNVLTNKKMKENDLKSLLMAASEKASEKVNEVANNPKHYNSVEEFEEAIVDNIIDTIRDLDYFYPEYSLSNILLLMSTEKMNIGIDGELYSVNVNDARILQYVWNHNAQRFADTLTDKFGVMIAVNYNETENIQKYQEILEGLSSENDVLSTISFLFSRFTEIEKRDKHTYVLNCCNYSDCTKIALDYLKANNKQFEGEQYIDVIATTDNDNVFIVLTK